GGGRVLEVDGGVGLDGLCSKRKVERLEIYDKGVE
ncbi:hypothetical protein A2U01_0074096, partial [Trifolium medium]|nr:hypothetical protein [Trifolium medium]